jgi:hypothetical protein
MSDIAITPVDPTFNTRSADLPAAGAAITTATTNTFAIAAGGRCNGQIVLFFESDSSGDTVTILAGDRPPSQDADEGADTIVLAASDLRAYFPTGRFLQNDGSIRATCTDDGTLCYALIIPHGAPGYPLT